MQKAKENPPRLPPTGIYKKDSLSYEDIMGAVLKTSKDSTGVIASCVGLVRSSGFAGRKITEFVIKTDPKYTDKALRRLCGEVKKKFGLQLAVIYRYEGSFRVGEILGMVVVAGSVRPETFSALDELVSRFNPECHIRRREIYKDGESEWIEK